jgi:O-methyltransferase
MISPIKNPLMERALLYARTIAYSSEQGLQFTYDMAVKYRDSPGVYVECGVAAGAQIIAMAAGAPNKTIYAFDSFEGIPFPSNRDDQMPGIRKLEDWEMKALPKPGHALLESTGATAVSLKDFEANIKFSKVPNPERIVAVKGWFEDVIPKFLMIAEPGLKIFPNAFDISILRLDGDLYNSTYVCLKHLYPKVIKGGLVIIDDWKLPGCQAAVIDYMREIGVNTLCPWLIEDKDSQVAYWNK